MFSAVSRVLSFVAAAMIGGVVVWWLGSGHDAPTAQRLPAPLPFAATAREAVVAVTEMPTAARLKIGGYVEPRSSVRLTAQAPGRVTFVAGQEGERMASGQLVVALDDEAMTAEYRAAWARMTGEMADAENAQTQLYHNLYGRPTSPMGGPGYEAYERATVPFYNMAQSFMGQMMPGMTSGPFAPFSGQSGPMMTQAEAKRSPPVINNARAEYERRLAGLAGAQAQIDGLDARLRDRRTIAPWSSVIMKRHVRVGDVVQPGQPLVDLSDVDQLDIRVEVPASLVGNLAVGDQVPVTLSSANIWTVVSQIFPAANDAQHTVAVKLALPAGAQAAPGMYAVAWIAQPSGGSTSAQTAAIPTTAIAYRGSLPIAFAIDERGVTEMRVLRLGDAQGERTAVLSGLRPGEMVVADPSPHLKAGDPATGRLR